MKLHLALAVAALLGGIRSTFAQAAPDIVWQVPTPNTLANSVQAVGWSPQDDAVAVGSTDRWFRLRESGGGSLLYSVLEPPHSHGVAAILFSHDGALAGVRNQASGMAFRVQRTIDGTFLGQVVGTLNANGLVTFAPDATLLANTGGDGTISSWSFSQLTVTHTTGSGYQTVTTAFDFSPDGALQSAAQGGRITIRRTSDASVVHVLRGGSKIEFSPDSSLLAAWSASPANEIAIWRTSDWSVLHRLTSPSALEGVAGLRFTLDGQRLVSSGYAPYQDASGLWQQKGFIRFFDVASGAIVVTYDEATDIAVTSPIAWSADGARFGYGLYNGTVAVANTPP